VLAAVLLAVGIFAAVRRRAVLAALALTPGALGLLLWVLETSGTVDV